MAEVALTFRRGAPRQLKNKKRRKGKRKRHHRDARELEEAQIDWVVFAESEQLVTNVIARLRDTYHIRLEDKPLLLKTLLHCPGEGGEVTLADVGRHLLQRVAAGVSPCLEAARMKN